MLRFKRCEFIYFFQFTNILDIDSCSCRKNNFYIKELHKFLNIVYKKITWFKTIIIIILGLKPNVGCSLSTWTDAEWLVESGWGESKIKAQWHVLEEIYLLLIQVWEFLSLQDCDREILRINDILSIYWNRLKMFVLVFVL